MTGLGPTIPALVEGAALSFGSATAIEDGAERLSFEDLALACTEAARAFITAGVEKGDRVAIWAPNLWEWVVAAVGAHAAGAVLVPLNTRLKGPEAAYVLGKSRARLLITMDEFLGVRYADMLVETSGGPGQGRPCRDLADLEAVVCLRSDSVLEDGRRTWGEFIADAGRTDAGTAADRSASVTASDPADIMFTSGTTGKPKGAVCGHGQNIRAFEVWTELVGLGRGDRYLIVNPFFHSFGYKAGWLSCIMRGATALPEAVFDVARILERIGEDRVSVLPGPPSIYQSILADPRLADFDISCLRLAVTGAAAIPVSLIHRMRDELGFETVVTAYGLTEACGLATMCRHDDDPETIATTSGRAIPDVEVLCVDDKGDEVARGGSGEIVIRGYNVMQGYFEDEAASRASIDADGWLHTGDVGVMDERGYIRITDRIKDMFIMGGFNCYPAEIESTLVEHEDIVQAAVIGVPDERVGEVGMAYLVTSGAATSGFDEKAVIGWCRERMANYKVPRYVEFVEELPMNASGKVTKFVLRDMARQRLSNGG